MQRLETVVLNFLDSRPPEQDWRKVYLQPKSKWPEAQCFHPRGHMVMVLAYGGLAHLDDQGYPLQDLRYGGWVAILPIDKLDPLDGSTSGLSIEEAYAVGAQRIANILETSSLFTAPSCTGYDDDDFAGHVDPLAWNYEEE